MNLRDLTVLSSLNRALAGQQKTAGFWSMSDKVIAAPFKLLGKGGWTGAKGALRLTAENPLLAGSTLAAGAGATAVADKGARRFGQELQQANQLFPPQQSIRGGLYR